MEERQPTPRLQEFPQLSRLAFFSAQNQGLVADYLAHLRARPLGHSFLGHRVSYSGPRRCPHESI